MNHREEFRKSFKENFPDVKSCSAVRFELTFLYISTYIRCMHDRLYVFFGL